MHPLIRVVTFMAFSLGLSLGQWPELVLGGVLLAAAYGGSGRRVSAQGRRMLVRLRWFFLSIAVLYLWFTPGEALLPALGAASPSWSGLAQGLLRTGSLVLIVLAVDLLLQLTPRDQMLGALYRLACLLRPLGLSAERFALRMSLTLEAVGRISLRPPGAVSRAAGWRQRVQRLGEALLKQWRRALRAPAQTLEVEILLDEAPPAWQWGLPVLLVAAFWAVGGLA